MSEGRKPAVDYIIILLLFANTLFLGGIFFSMACPAKKGWCPMAQKGSICPFSKSGSGSQKGSAGSQKGSM